MSAGVHRWVGVLLSLAAALAGLLFALRMDAWLGALSGMDVNATVWVPRGLPWLAALLSLGARLLSGHAATVVLVLASLLSYFLLMDGWALLSTLQGFDTPLRLLARSTGALEIALALLNLFAMALRKRWG